MAEEALLDLLDDAPIHERYLPFSSRQLARHFVRGSDDARQIRYYRESAARYRQISQGPQDAGGPGSIDSVRLARQIEKDERFWTVATLMAMYYCPERVRLMTALLDDAFDGAFPAVGLTSWNECLDGNLQLFFEVEIPSPADYRASLRGGRAAAHLIPYVREAAQRRSERALEGPTHLDALLVNSDNGFAVFFEAKVLSDTSCHVSFDPTRNQIARNVDVMLEKPADTSGRASSKSAIVASRRPDGTLFVLLTPQAFREYPQSRLYGWLMNDYRNHGASLARDLPHRTADWESVRKRLGWTSFERANEILPGACRWL